MAASILFEGIDTDSAEIGSGGSYTFSLTVGSAAGQERIVALASSANNAGSPYASCTIDGQTATKLAEITGPGSAFALASIWRAPGTGNTAINVVATRGGGGGSNYCGYCAVWTLSDAGTLLDTATAGVVSDPTLDVDTATGGVAVAALFGFTSAGGGATAWTGLTEDFDSVSVFGGDVFAGASATISSGATPRSISADVTPSFSETCAGVCVSFNPAGVVTPPEGGQQIIDVGSAIDDGTGDPVRTAFTKCNDNFTELYAATWGNVSSSGTPTVNQYARWVTATTIQGVASATVLSDIGAQPAGSYQPLDADLTAIAALTGTNTIYYRSGTNTWTGVTIGGNMTFAGGTLNAVTGSSVTDVIPHCGRLEWVSATALSFKPYNGDRIKINGTIYAIPSAGITGLANTGVFVGGVAGQNLAASGVYNVYAFNNGGTITADFVTAATAHVTSTTAGNVGTEIKTGDDTRTLIGKAATNASAQFEDAIAARHVINWFNRRDKPLIGALVGGATTTSATLVELGTSARIFFLTWADEGVSASVAGLLVNSVVGNVQLSITLDGAASVLPQPPIFTVAVASYNGPAVVTYSYQPSEGKHYFNAMGATNAGTATYYVSLAGMIRG